MNLDMDPKAELLGWYSSLRFDDLPPAAIAAARDLIIDAVGCGLSGSSTPPNAELIERYGRWGGIPEATVFGARFRLPTPAATWLNAAMIHADDFDDTHDDTSIHLGVTIIPAVFAAAEATGRLIPGREVITAVAGAAELAIRLGYAVRGHLHSGWLPTTLFGAIAAAAGAAKVMGLGRAQLLDAVGLGYAQMHGNRQSLLEATLTKRIQPAFSARAGVEAAVLAEVGIEGPQRIVDGDGNSFPKARKTSSKANSTSKPTAAAHPAGVIARVTQRIPRPHHRDLAQLPHRSDHPTIPDRLRSLTLESII